MRLAGRIAALVRHADGDPALHRQWVDFLTRIGVSCTAWVADHPEDVAMLDAVFDETGIADAARYYASRDIPATISDWLRHLDAVTATDIGASNATDSTT